MTYFQPFFGWLLQTTLIASVVICLILLIQKILGGKLGPRWCHALWLVLLIRMILPWAPSSRLSLSNLIPSWDRQVQSQQLPGIAEQQEVSPPAETAENPDAIPEKEPQSKATIRQVVASRPQNLANVEGKFTPGWASIRQVLSVLWLAGAIVIGAYLLMSNFALWRIVKRDRPLVKQAMLELFEECKEQMGVQSLVAVVPSSQIKSPALFGFIRPRLLLPLEMLETATREEMRYVFMHELAHLRRHDIYLGWLTSLLQVMHWFNPFIWFAFYRMRTDRELACDALVLTRTGQDKSHEYGGVILGLLRRFSHSRHLPAMAGIIENKSQLKRRIAMITQFKNNSYRWSPLATILIVLLSVVSLPDAKLGKASEVPAEQPAFTDIARQGGEIISRELKIEIGWNSSLSLSRDGSKLAFCRRKNGKDNLVVHSIVSSEETEVTNQLTGHAWIPVLSPDGNQIAYSLMEEKTNSLHIVSIQTGKDRLLDYSGFALDWSRDGRFILGSDGSTLSMLSVNREAVEKMDLSLPNGCSDERFSPDGKYVSYSIKGNIHLYPIVGGNAIQITRGSNDDRQAIWSADGKNLIFLSRRAFGPERDLCGVPIVSGKASGDVFIIKPDFGDSVQLYSLSDKGRLLYKRRLEDCQIFSTAINPRTGQPAGEPVRMCSGSHPVWSPDGKRIAYIYKGTLRVMPASGGQNQEVMKTGFHESGTYSWAPDNDTIYIQERGKDGFGISAISISRKERRSILPEDKHINCIHLTSSPDGKRLAFLKPASPSQKNQIFIVGVDGANLRQITHYEDGYINYPAWSPDGKEIAFEYGPAGGIKKVIVISVDDGSTREVFCGTDSDEDRFFGKSWSPDGSKIAWSTWNGTRIGHIADGKYEALKVNIDSTYGSYEPHGPSWSPDGTQMLFFTYKRIEQLMLMENFLPEDIGK